MALRLEAGGRQPRSQALRRLPAPTQLAGGTGLSKRSQASRGQSRGKCNRLRIIGGQWRGRKLDFPDVEGLRPTPDRVRETLFNWLQGHVVGTHCLDLFAGSGALGLEALSRGAKRLVWVDDNALATQQLNAHLRRLQSDAGVVCQLDARAFLQRGPGGAQYDLVFLDPPFGKGLVQESMELLKNLHWLNTGAHLYIEMESSLSIPALPQNWQLIREQVAGQVRYALIHVD